MPEALPFALPMRLGMGDALRVLYQYCCLLPASEAFLQALLAKKEIWFSTFTAFCLAHSIYNGVCILLYLCVETVEVKFVRNGDSLLTHLKFLRILTLVVQALLSDDHFSEQNLHTEPCTIISC